MKKAFFTITIFILVLVLAACSKAPSETAPAESTAPVDSAQSETPAEPEPAQTENPDKPEITENPAAPVIPEENKQEVSVPEPAQNNTSDAKPSEPVTIETLEEKPAQTDTPADTPKPEETVVVQEPVVPTEEPKPNETAVLEPVVPTEAPKPEEPAAQEPVSTPQPEVQKLPGKEVKYNLTYQTENKDSYKVYAVSKEESSDTVVIHLDFEAPEGSYIFAFNPPNGDKYKNNLSAKGVRETISLEIPADVFGAVEGISVSISKTGADSDRILIYIPNGNGSSEQSGNTVTYNEPVLTKGNALDYPKYINCNSGTNDNGLKLTVYSLTSQKLDNGYFRLKLTYKVDSGSRIRVFCGRNSREVIGYSKPSDGNSSTFTVDVPESDIAALSSDDCISFIAFDPDNRDKNCPASAKRDDVLLKNTIKGSIYEASSNTNGKTVGDSWNVPFVQMQKSGYEVYGISAQKLDNGYIRVSMDFKAPKGLNILAYDNPNSTYIKYFGPLTTGERQTYVVDLFISDLKSFKLLNFNIFKTNNSFCVDINTADILSGI